MVENKDMIQNHGEDEEDMKQAPYIKTQSHMQSTEYKWILFLGTKSGAGVYSQC